jgi:pimeloyl-ACP methyl ester carboxylesterase
VVEHLGVSGFALGGNSMGGGATWRYTLAYPEKVIAMILIDASGLPQWRSERVQSSDVGNERRPLAFTLLSKPWFRAIARYIDPYQLAAQGVRASYNNSPVVDQALIDRYYELSIREGTRDATLARFSGYSTGKVAAINLSVLRQPTLIMWGAEDALIPVSVADKFEMALPNARKVVYEDVGHIPMEELPDRSADDVRAFLRTL